MLEKDARNFLERTPYQYINIRRDWSGKVVNGEGGSDETTVLRTRYQGKCRKFGTDSLGGQCRGFTSPRKTQKTMDGRHTLCPNKKHVTTFYTITLTISVRLQ